MIWIDMMRGRRLSFIVVPYKTIARLQALDFPSVILCLPIFFICHIRYTPPNLNYRTCWLWALKSYDWSSIIDQHVPSQNCKVCFFSTVGMTKNPSPNYHHSWYKLFPVIAGFLLLYCYTNITQYKTWLPNQTLAPNKATASCHKTPSEISTMWGHSWQ